MKTLHLLALGLLCYELSAPLASAADEAAAQGKPAAQNPPAPIKVKNLTADEFEAKTADQQNVILDVRTPKEFRSGHLRGAVNIDYNAPDFDQKISNLDTSKSYLVYCAVGGRSAKACQKMGRLPF